VPARHMPEEEFAKLSDGQKLELLLRSYAGAFARIIQLLEQQNELLEQLAVDKNGRAPVRRRRASEQPELSPQEEMAERAFRTIFHGFFPGR